MTNKKPDKSVGRNVNDTPAVPSLGPDGDEPKVVKTEDRVENNKRPSDGASTDGTRDMGDVVAKDSIAEDGVKQSP